MADSCSFGGIIKANGNCTSLDSDGLAVQSVGEWSPQKHERLKLYIEATRAVRAKFLPPKGNGGAAFIDIFAGPGRARVRDQPSVVDGSPLVALAHTAAPFTKAILCDLDSENVNRVEIIQGDCNQEISRIVQLIPPYGLNVALIDPFGAKDFKWKTIAQLGSVERMDLLLHFPTGR